MDEKARKELTVEETLEALDQLIDEMEKGDGSLEDAFRNYEEGMKLVKSCNEKIETIEKKDTSIKRGGNRRRSRCGG